jgi:hypothetical protein
VVEREETMRHRSWRERLAPIIASVIAETAGEEESERRRALRAAWSEAGLGAREMHPYKIWCSEVRRQLAKGRPPPASTEPLGGLFAREEDESEPAPNR